MESLNALTSKTPFVVSTIPVLSVQTILVVPLFSAVTVPSELIEATVGFVTLHIKGDVPP